MIVVYYGDGRDWKIEREGSGGEKAHLFWDHHIVDDVLSSNV